MYCRKCGAENTANAKYCKVCGQQFPDIGKNHTQKPKKPALIAVIVGISLLVAIAVIIAITAGSDSGSSANKITRNSVLAKLNEGDLESALRLFDEQRTKLSEAEKNSIETKLAEMAEETVAAYEKRELNYDDAMSKLNQFYKWDFPDLRKDIQSKKTQITELNSSRAAFDKAEELYAQGHYIEAVAEYRRIPSTSPDYQMAIERTENALDAYRQSILDAAKEQADQGDYSSAIHTIKAGLADLSEDDALSSQLEQYCNDFAQIVLSSAEAKWEAGDLEGAIAILQNAQSDNPDEQIQTMLNDYLEQYNKKRIELISSRDYKNERAWIKYETGEGVFLGSFDKTGTEIFRLNAGSIADYTDYDEEYAYIKNNDNSWIVLNKSGEQLYTIDDAHGGNVLAYGGGYVFCTHHEDSFDTSYDVYEIYDPSGQATSIDIGGSYGDACYCGDSIFGIELRGSWDWTVTFYNSEGQNWIVPPTAGLTGSNNVRFENGLTCFGIKYYDPDDTGYRSSLRIANTTGWYEVPIHEGWSWNDYGAGYHDGAVVLYESYDGDLYSFELASEKLSSMDKRYSSRIEEGEFQDRSGFYSKETGFINDRLVIFMKGDDKDRYIGLFDKDLNPVKDIMKYTTYIGFDGYRLVVEQNGETVVYDQDGNELYTASSIGVRTIAAFSDGVAMTEVGKYIDRDGNSLFTEITLSEG